MPLTLGFFIIMLYHIWYNESRDELEISEGWSSPLIEVVACIIKSQSGSNLTQSRDQDGSRNIYTLHTAVECRDLLMLLTSTANSIILVGTVECRTI